MKIFVPDEILRSFDLLIKQDDNPHDQWNLRIQLFPYLGYLDGVLEFDHCQICLFDFNILFLHPNYS